MLAKRNGIRDKIEGCKSPWTANPTGKWAVDNVDGCARGINGSLIMLCLGTRWDAYHLLANSRCSKSTFQHCSTMFNNRQQDAISTGCPDSEIDLRQNSISIRSRPFTFYSDIHFNNHFIGNFRLSLLFLKLFSFPLNGARI